MMTSFGFCCCAFPSAANSSSDSVRPGTSTPRLSTDLVPRSQFSAVQLVLTVQDQISTTRLTAEPVAWQYDRSPLYDFQYSS
eukprot:1904980-Rhodomonas_salina.1